MNITDVDDKIIRNATAEHKELKEYTAIYTKAFWRIAPPSASNGPSTSFPRPTTSRKWPKPSRN